MCGISGIFGGGWSEGQLKAMVKVQHHRGPDAQGLYLSAGHKAGLGHNRLSILDLSEAGRQPMSDSSGRYRIIFNGEIYNYLELRKELSSSYSFKSRTDTEVLLAAYLKWGRECLERLIGMFAFMIWDEKEQKLFAARDRFGVKPFYYHTDSQGRLFAASEIKAIHAAGINREMDLIAWATYLTYGLYDHSQRTFWKHVQALPAGCWLEWQEGMMRTGRWYELSARVGADFDLRPDKAVREEYLSLLKESVRLRFRSDVPVGINLSGGLDSSLLLGVVQEAQGPDSEVKAFTFITGHPDYDELPWVRKMLEKTKHPSVACLLTPDEVPDLAQSVQYYEDEPYGGIPTLAYAKLFEQARSEGVLVLLDGQGLDEQWGGYDYYQEALRGGEAGLIQGTKESPVRPECLKPEFRALAEPFEPAKPFPDTLRNLQYRDICYTKIPRALRFNDRISMRASTELREPFLDYRLVELALRQPEQRKIKNGVSKHFLRGLARNLLPGGVVDAPKRPLQTPQREWIRTSLRAWISNTINRTPRTFSDIGLCPKTLHKEWQKYKLGKYKNSFYVWQWISCSLLARNDRLDQSKN